MDKGLANGNAEDGAASGVQSPPRFPSISTTERLVDVKSKRNTYFNFHFRESRGRNETGETSSPTAFHILRPAKSAPVIPVMNAKLSQPMLSEPQPETTPRCRSISEANVTQSYMPAVLPESMGNGKSKSQARETMHGLWFRLCHNEYILIKYFSLCEEGS